MAVKYFTTDTQISNLATKMTSLFPLSSLIWPEGFIDALSAMPLKGTFGNTNNFNELIEGTCTTLSDDYIYRFGRSGGGLFSFGDYLGKSLITISTKNCSRIFSWGCSGISTLKTFIGPQITIIDQEGLVGCYNLETIRLPKLKILGELGLAGLSGDNAASYLYLPELEELIGSHQFQYDVRLLSINMPKLRIISPYCFQSCYQLSEVDLNSVLDIGEYAFTNCYYLKRACFASADIIKYKAFAECSSLSEVRAPRVETIVSEAFQALSNLRKFEYGSTLSYIGSKAFQSCSKLKQFINLDDSDNIIGIGSMAFSDCLQLQSFSASQLERLSVGAFYGCSSLSILKCPKLSSFGVLALADTNINYLELGFSSMHSETLGQIETLSVETLVLPYLTHISSYTFSSIYSGMSTLRYLSFPALTTVMTGAFNARSDIISLDGVLPNLQEVREFAFYGCNIPSAVQASNLSLVGDYAFAFCSGLNYFFAEDQLSSIGSYAFEYAPNLSMIRFPSVNTIGKYCFTNCTKLETVSFPVVTSIGDAAFYGCTSLCSVKIGTSSCTIGTSVFDDCSSNLEIYVPQEYLESYKISPGWSSYSDYLRGYN